MRFPFVTRLGHFAYWPLLWKRDQKLIRNPVSPLAGGRQGGDLLPGQIGDDTQGLGYHGLGDERVTGHRKLDKTDFGPILLPASGQSQGKPGSRGREAC